MSPLVDHDDGSESAFSNEKTEEEERAEKKSSLPYKRKKQPSLTIVDHDDVSELFF